MDENSHGVSNAVTRFLKKAGQKLLNYARNTHQIIILLSVKKVFEEFEKLFFKKFLKERVWKTFFQKVFQE